MSSTSTEKQDRPVHAHVVMQQCISAKLQTNAHDPMQAPQYAVIGRGVVVYVCFMAGATAETVEKMAKTITSIKLSKCSEENDSLLSVIDLPGDILVVPQATLGGKPKGKRIQYHGNVEKGEGKKLYDLFLQNLKKTQESSELCKEYKVKTECGTYGNLQVLSVETNGPFTHIFRF